ncbi:NirD/YgiW/YdeI family stress tolerance protein [Bordetella parapertussis]|uniref:Exported protein n=3 Tax=Bordetella TaxID=517 RepID=A0A0H3LVW1_BORBR|nr:MULTISPECIES: NirD/YgiW/YdeI family stress tolerance protein [Bordetella]KAK65490.1 OB domain protein [Bordetella bronchiseptica 980-2]AMG88899.1 hypothetical protein AL472_14870 [Bordetella bronchiseptica]AOB38783.1 hypothetical protein BBB43_07980 [Bordetella parapertussis]AUL42771.1 hypothetical protein BTL54_08060 [Bordetella parapertussis]AWP63709.1 hypothetical protein B7P06_13995 [Bordetella parapertussis]
MSKSIVLTLAAVALATQAGLAQAQYVGPSSNQQMSVKELLDTARDDAVVTLRGKLVKQLSDDTYLLDDGTGRVQVEIDRHLFPPNQPVDANTLVEVSGEFDKEVIGTSEVEVKALRILGAAK